MRVLTSLSCLSLLGVRHLLCDPVHLPMSTFRLTMHARSNFSHLPRLAHQWVSTHDLGGYSLANNFILSTQRHESFYRQSFTHPRYSRLLLDTP